MLTPTLTPLKSYQQYSQVSWYREFLNCINKTRQQLFVDFINNQFVPSINIQTSQSLYLAYYIQYLFGMYRPLGASSSNSFYDTGELYDSLNANNIPIVYDDSEEYNGRISIKEFSILLRFALDYGEEIVNQPLIIRFVSEICKIEPNDIKIKFTDEETIKFILPNTAETQNFLKITINYYDWLGLPFGVGLDFVITE